MLTIYKLLEKKARPRDAFKKSEEMVYFMEHRDLLTKISHFAFLYDSDHDDFDVMRANIILFGLENKKIIEQEIRSLTHYIEKAQKTKFKIALKERTVDLPYFQSGKDKIFVPFFSRAINLLVTNSPEELLNYPYTELVHDFTSSIIDPFDTYGADLYNSYFTRLIRIASNGREVAYFHYDTNTIYIINDEGRLDCKIVLFDKYMKKISNSHMLERIRPVVDAYFANNREEFIENLYKNAFISAKMKQLIARNKR